jgi:hypothetical protein
VKESVWGGGRVAAGPHDGYPSGSFERLPDGPWKSGVTILDISKDRITGPNVDVSYTRVDGGFRLSGLWLGHDVELLVDVREADGTYVSKALPGLAHLPGR